MSTKIFAAVFLALPLFAGCGKNEQTTGKMIEKGTRQFTVTADNAPKSYTVNGFENAAITMKRGTSYSFSVHALGHPFYIFWTTGNNPANAYTNGVSGNGVEVGTLTFTVPSTAPTLLYYGSSADSAMIGTITVED